MTYAEKKAWLQVHLAACLGEELPGTMNGLTFAPESLKADEMLYGPIEVLSSGRILSTLTLDNVTSMLENVPVLSQASFTLACSTHPVLQSWLLWNVDRGKLSLT